MNGFLSIRQIMDDLMAHPLLRDLSLERVVNYTYDFLRIVGCNKLFIEKVETIIVDDYRAQLPCDFVSIIQVKGKHDKEYRYTTDNFHLEHNKECNIESTYKIQGDVIYTSNEHDVLTIAYKAVALDEDGFPMVPDNASFKAALELYIKRAVFTVLFDLGKINLNVLQVTQQQYAWYVGQAQTSMIKPTADEMESFTRMWNTLIPRVREHRTGFKFLGNREYIKNH